MIFFGAELIFIVVLEEELLFHIIFLTIIHKGPCIFRAPEFYGTMN